MYSDLVPFVSPSLRLDGKTALITGAGGGIGEGIALTFANAGAHVILVGRNRDPLDPVAVYIRAQGGEATVAVCDVTDTSAIRALIDELPALDILVNNAGTNFPEPMVEVSDEHLDAMLNLNVRACFVTAQAAAKKMLSSQSDTPGVVVNITVSNIPLGHMDGPS